MSTAVVSRRQRTLEDLVHQLGDIPLSRIRLDPPPGSATIDDVAKTKCVELIDGTLVEKPMGYRESMLASYLIRVLNEWVGRRNLGIVTGEQGGMELVPNLVRIPDVSFVSWESIPQRKVPSDVYPPFAPDLAVEVLSPGNTPREMARKRKELFDAGTRLYWEIDPEARTVAVYRSPNRRRLLTETQTLDGGSVLRGFRLPLSDLFAELDRKG